MSEQKEKSRSFCLDYTTAKTELVTAVNRIMRERGIPCYIMEDLLTNVLYQVSTGAAAERHAAETQKENCDGK